MNSPQPTISVAEALQQIQDYISEIHTSGYGAAKKRRLMNAFSIVSAAIVAPPSTPAGERDQNGNLIIRD